MNAKIIVLFIVALFSAILFWPQNLSDEEAIHQTLNHAIAGLSERDLSLIMDGISEEYLDENRFNKKALKGILFQQFQRKQSIIVQPSDKRLSLTPPTAHIDAQADVLAGSLLDRDGNSVSFEVHIAFQKEEDTWRIVSHKRERLIP